MPEIQKVSYAFPFDIFLSAEPDDAYGILVVVHRDGRQSETN